MTRRAALALTALGAAAWGATGVTAHAAPVPASTPLVVLFSGHTVHAAPYGSAKRTATVAGRRPLTGVRTVLPVLDRASDSKGREWVRVALAGRPNGSTGWIRTVRTRPMSTAWHITVDLSARRVTARNAGEVRRRFRVVIGAASTPTPRGRFFVEEAMSLSSSATGGPYALATSARSNVLQQFGGGPGQIALHGRNGLYEPLGSAASHGCIRLSTRAITWLARRIGAGVPLSIVR